MIRLEFPPLLRLLGLVLVLLFESSILNAQYLQNGEIGWRKTLEGRMRRGNGIQITRDGVLVATTDNGMLHFIQNVTPEPIVVAVYSPTSVMADGAILLCRSKPVLASGMAIYAVSNTVLAVNITDYTTVYAMPLPSKVVGTPAVSRRGQSIYVTHNDDTTNVGSISVLSLATGQLLATLQDTSGGVIVPFGPPAVVHRTNTADDVVVFGDATDAGYSSTTLANLYALLWNGNEHAARQGVGESSYQLIIAATNVRTVITAPEFTNDLRVFIGGQGSLVTAYDNNAQYNLFDGNDRTVGASSWTAQLDVDPTNALARTYLSVYMYIYVRVYCSLLLSCLVLCCVDVSFDVWPCSFNPSRCVLPIFFFSRQTQSQKNNKLIQYNSHSHHARRFGR
jgi:hypothetical protein